MTADEYMGVSVKAREYECSPTAGRALEHRIADLIEAQRAMTVAIGDLARSIAMLAQSVVDEEMPENAGGTLDD